MKQNLQRSIENLYRVFAKYSLKSKIEGCPCCVGKRDNRGLHSKSLRDLTGEDLSYFGFKAMTTFGDVEDFKHFLPRLFEIAINGDFAYNDEILFGKLDSANWQNWDEKEKTALKNFFFELFSNAVDFDEQNAYLTETYLIGIATAVDDISPYLDLWLENITTNKIETLHYFVVECNYGMSAAFLAKDSRQRELIVNWLTSIKTINMLESNFLSNQESKTNSKLSAILEVVYGLQKSS
jgi:hypothetical protein